MYLNGGSDDAVQLLQTSTKSSSLLRTITVPKVSLGVPKVSGVSDGF